MTRRNPFIGGEGEDDGTSAGEPPTDRPPVSGEPTRWTFDKDAPVTVEESAGAKHVRYRPPASGEPSTEASVDYAVHLMENMLRSAAPYHKPFIEQHIANVRALAEARATPPSLDPRGPQAIEAIDRIQRAVLMMGRKASDGRLVTESVVVDEVREALRDFHAR